MTRCSKLAAQLSRAAAESLEAKIIALTPPSENPVNFWQLVYVADESEPRLIPKGQTFINDVIDAKGRL